MLLTSGSRSFPTYADPPGPQLLIKFSINIPHTPFPTLKHPDEYTHLNADDTGLQTSEAALVKGVKGFVSHGAWLQHIATVPTGHEEGLVHLHRLVWKSGITVCPVKLP